MSTLRDGVLELADHWAGSARASAWLVDRADELRQLVRTSSPEPQVVELQTRIDRAIRASEVGGDDAVLAMLRELDP